MARFYGNNMNYGYFISRDTNFDLSGVGFLEALKLKTTNDSARSRRPCVCLLYVHVGT